MPARASVLLAVALLAACGPGSRPNGAPAPPSPESPNLSRDPSPAGASPVSDHAPPARADDVVGPPSTGRRYTIVVSFTSPGDGTDRAAYERLLGVVRDVGAGKVGRVSGRWGKEGEHDECFDLSRLPHRERLAFTERVRLSVGTSDRVTISENAPCRHEEGR